MKIIGGRDYWDSATWRDDTDRVYKRNTEAYRLEEILKSQTKQPQDHAMLHACVELGVLQTVERSWGYQRSHTKFIDVDWRYQRPGEKLNITHVSIFFCGELFRGASINGKTYWDEQAALDKVAEIDPSYNPKLTRWDWGPDGKKTVFHGLGWKEATEQQIEFAVQHKIVSAICGYAIVKTYLAETPRGTEHLVADHISLNSPWLRYNGLQTLVNPVAANQAVEMWLGRFESSERPIVQITDDKVKRDKHGFDKMSFKKGKSE